MDILAKLIGCLPVRVIRTDRRGAALAATLLSLMLIGTATAAALWLADINRQSSRNREDAAQALQIAESGLAHALAIIRGPLLDSTATKLLRGSDGAANTADDGYLVNFGLPSGVQIPATGVAYNGGTYFVRLIDDPAETDADSLTDTNRRILVKCRGITATGAAAETRVTVLNLVMPGIAVDGDLEISSSADLMGRCGGAHANGKLYGGGSPSSTAGWSSTTGSIPGSFSGPKATNAAPFPIPDLDVAEYCADADFFVNGNWSLTSSRAPGTYCIDGDVTSSGDFGSMSSMKQITIIATGSISISSKPFIKADHPDGILLLAGGDLDLQGDWGGRGLVYGHGHCYISSKPTIQGQLVCRSKEDPAGADDRTDNNLISGDAQITFTCNSELNEAWRIVAWYPAIGT